MSKQFSQPNKGVATQSREAMNQVFAEAHKEIEKGRIALVNLDGDIGKEALTHIAAVLGDTQSVASWVGAEDVDHASGNCFFATTQMMLDLMNANRSANFKLASGEFHHKDTDPIIHAWLEYSRAGETVAVNVSNLKTKPLYAMDKATYLENNRCRVKLQRLTPQDIMGKLRTFLGGGALLGAEVDVRAFTKLLLRKTLHQRFLQATGRRK